MVLTGHPTVSAPGLSHSEHSFFRSSVALLCFPCRTCLDKEIILEHLLSLLDLVEVLQTPRTQSTQQHSLKVRQSNLLPPEWSWDSPVAPPSIPRVLKTATLPPPISCLLSPGDIRLKITRQNIGSGPGHHQLPQAGSSLLR